MVNTCYSYVSNITIAHTYPLLWAETELHTSTCSWSPWDQTYSPVTIPRSIHVSALLPYTCMYALHVLSLSNGYAPVIIQI